MICSWCGKIIRELDPNLYNNDSNGICDECRDKLYKKHGIREKDDEK